MNDKDKQANQREYQRKYREKHRPQYTHKHYKEGRESAFSRYNADVLIPIQEQINKGGFINGSKC